MENHKVFVASAGSTSFKFAIYSMPEEKLLVFGNFQGIGSSNCDVTLKISGSKENLKTPNLSYKDAVEKTLDLVIQKKIIKSLDEISAVGHRVVNGGEIFKNSIILTDSNLLKLEEINDLAPLHNPIAIKCFKLFKDVLKNVNHVAVFDTSFHTTLKEEDFLFPIPINLYSEHKIRKYGAHGTNYRWLIEKFNEIENRESSNIIACHIGGGVSLCAIENNKSIATTMGLSPLGGAMMATRSGDIDPTVVQYISRIKNISIEKTIEYLNKESGLKGLSGLDTGDLRIIHSKIDSCKFCNDAWNVFIRRICDYIGQYHIRLKGNIDGIVFSAGIPENSEPFRLAVLEKISKALNLSINYESLKKRDDIIEFTNSDSKIKVYMIAANEECLISRDAFNLKNRTKNER